MKTIPPTNAAQKLMGEARLARLQLAKAESQLTEAKEQAHLARRRRKEAKQTARRAKKQARLAKEKVAGAKRALAKLEAKLVRPKPAKVKRKPRKQPAKKAAVAPRRKSPVAAVDAKSREILKVRKPLARRTKSKRKPGPTGKATVQNVKGVEKIFTGEIETETSTGLALSEIPSPAVENPATPNQISTTNPQETP